MRRETTITNESMLVEVVQKEASRLGLPADTLDALRDEAGYYLHEEGGLPIWRVVVASDEKDLPPEGGWRELNDPYPIENWFWQGDAWTIERTAYRNGIQVWACVPGMEHGGTTVWSIGGGWESMTRRENAGVAPGPVGEVRA